MMMIPVKWVSFSNESETRSIVEYKDNQYTVSNRMLYVNPMRTNEEDGWLIDVNELTALEREYNVRRL